VTATEARPKVLFVVGKGRSGSTLFDRVVGTLDGFFSMGEVWRWRRSVPLGGELCGCGVTLAECRVWSGILSRACAEAGERLGVRVTPDEILEWEQSVLRWRSVPRLLAGGRPDWPALRKLAAFQGCLYRVAADVTGADVFVDSSKWPCNPVVLGLVEGIEVYAVHLVRDPRAVAHSWRRRKRWSEDGELMPRQTGVGSALSWLARTMLAERVLSRMGHRAVRVRYEDFVDDPEGVLRVVARLVGRPHAESPALRGRRVDLGRDHLVWGNATRFHTGSVTLASDEEWRAGLSHRPASLVSVITWPGRRLLGFPWRMHDPSAGDRDPGPK